MSEASRPLLALAGLVALLASGPARAEDAPKPAPAKVAEPAPSRAEPAPATQTLDGAPWEREKAKLRSGFTAGIALGSGLASFAGYPNDAKKIGYQRYYTATGASFGSVAMLWVGGALTDWFVFGVGFSGGAMPLLSDKSATAGGVLFHTEVFPLLPLGGYFKDLGVMLDVGTGSANVNTKDDPPKKLIDSGMASSIGTGVFFEAVRLWKFHGGPFLSGNYFWSDTVRRPGIFLGWRMALFTGP